MSRRFPLRGLGLVATALLLGFALSGCLREQSDVGTAQFFPRKPVKVVVPFPAGGGSDRFVRVVQKAVRDEGLLSQPLVVINVPGAGGTVGSRRVRQAAADGHTILCLHEGILSSKYAGRVPFGPEAFRPIAATGQSDLVLCVREDSGFDNLTDLMSSVREKPNQIRFGMAQGAPTHFVGRQLEAASGDREKTKFRLVASGGGAKRFSDLVGGHIEVTPFSLAEYASFGAGGVRALAYLGAERLREMPGLPTAREQGFDVIMTHVQYWWAPRSTPDAAVEKVADALEAAMKTGYVEQRLEEMKIRPLLLRGDALRTHLAVRESEFQEVALLQFDGLVPSLVPAVSVLVMMFALLVVFQSVRGGRVVAALMETEWRPLAFGLGSLLIYVLSMQYFQIPFALATAVFVPLLGVALGTRSAGAVVRLAGLGLGLGLACFVIFTKVLVIDLP